VAATLFHELRTQDTRNDLPRGASSRARGQGSLPTTIVADALSIGVIVLVFIVGSVQAAGAQTLQVDVNIPYIVQFGFGSYEVRHPLGVRVKNLVPDVEVSFIHYYFFPSVKFSLPGRSPLEVSNQFEFGVSVGFAGPSKLWIFENSRIGVSYRFGDGLTDVRVNFGFPF
jgi:hypothetical protein